MRTYKLDRDSFEEIDYLNSKWKSYFPESKLTLADFFLGYDDGNEVYEDPWCCIVTDDYDNWDYGGHYYKEIAILAKEIAEKNPEKQVRILVIKESIGACVELLYVNRKGNST